MCTPVQAMQQSVCSVYVKEFRQFEVTFTVCPPEGSRGHQHPLQLYTVKSDGGTTGVSTVNSVHLKKLPCSVSSSCLDHELSRGR